MAMMEHLIKLRCDDNKEYLRIYQKVVYNGSLTDKSFNHRALAVSSSAIPRRNI